MKRLHDAQLAELPALIAIQGYTWQGALLDGSPVARVLESLAAEVAEQRADNARLLAEVEKLQAGGKVLVAANDRHFNNARKFAEEAEGLRVAAGKREGDGEGALECLDKLRIVLDLVPEATPEQILYQVVTLPREAANMRKAFIQELEKSATLTDAKIQTDNELVLARAAYEESNALAVRLAGEMGQLQHLAATLTDRITDLVAARNAAATLLAELDRKVNSEWDTVIPHLRKALQKTYTTPETKEK